MTHSGTEIPDLTLERFVLEELPPAEQQALAGRIAGDTHLQRRVQVLKDSNSSLLQQYPPAWIGRQISMRTQCPQPFHAQDWWAWTRLWFMPAAAALALAVVVPGMLRDGPRPETRIKGLRPQLQLFRHTAQGGERLSDSSLARSGDRIQLTYLAAGEPYGAILSVDGHGTQTLHLPASGQHAVSLTQGRPDTLAFSYELDDAPRWERFYFITADIPFDLAVVRRAVQKSVSTDGERGLALPPGFHQQPFTLTKDPAP